MNLTFLALSISLGLSVIIYLIYLSISLGLSVIIYLIYKKSSKGYTVQKPVQELKNNEYWEVIIDELESTIDSSPVLAETVHPETPIKKEVKRKTPKKKAIPQPIVNSDELPKTKKSTYKKSYNRKKKDTKKDKGDDLLLS